MQATTIKSLLKIFTLTLSSIVVSGCMPWFRYETHLPPGPISDYLEKSHFLIKENDLIEKRIQSVVLTQCIDSNQSLDKCSMSCVDDKCTYYGHFKFIPVSKEVNQVHGKLGIIAFEVIFYPTTKNVVVNKREI